MSDGIKTLLAAAIGIGATVGIMTLVAKLVSGSKVAFIILISICAAMLSFLLTIMALYILA